MRRTLRARSKRYRSKTRRVQRGGGLPYDWVSTALGNPFYQNSELYKTEQIPVIPLTSESIEEVSLEEVAKHLKVLVGPIKSYKDFWQTIQAKSEIQVGQADNEFVSITIPWMEEVEKYLRSSIPQGMNTEGVLSGKAVVTDPKSYPLLIWSLIASAPSTADIIPVLGP
jgi:hypothetical protein